MDRFFSKLDLWHVRRLMVASISLLIVLGAIMLLNDSKEQQVRAKVTFTQEKSLNELIVPASDLLSYQVVLPALDELMNDESVVLVSTTRLGVGESETWREAGCRDYNCIHITFYDYENRGTIEMVIREETRSLVAQWNDATDRPAPNEAIGELAMEIARQDSEVVSVLGDLNEVMPAMIPMSVWLLDNPCEEAWCVDLTFDAPDGSGRIFHIVVNIEEQTVADTFYSRARPEQIYDLSQTTPSASQDDLLFHNGCHEQYDWQVCWETTAHDGVNFYNATYAGKTIFSSAKIGQVEVFYSNWPGGYRDEIGYAASVPPKFGTNLTDLEDGFIVEQMFTEPFDWPSCVCCYRYTQKMTFYVDGSFEPGFISHGPGCDDPSTYRPFWRIDLWLDDQEGDEVWYWEDDKWVEMETEQEISLYDDTSPNDEKIATFDGDLHYRWIPIRTDPFGVDEAKIFILQNRSSEGNFPIEAGSANTFQPPAQWVNGETVSGEDIAIWYIPILKTKRGDPWWCMPEPAPNFSPCTASVLVKADGTLPLNSPVQTPIATRFEASTITPTIVTALPVTITTPTIVASITATLTPFPIAGDTATLLWQNAGCGTCHTLDSLDADGEVGPNLTYIGDVASERIMSVTARDYLYQSIVDPNAYIVTSCPESECHPNIMPTNYHERMTEAQIELLVDFLLVQRQQVPHSTNTGTPQIIGNITATKQLVATPTTVQNINKEGNVEINLVIVVIPVLGIIMLVFIVFNRRQNPTV